MEALDRLDQKTSKLACFGILKFRIGKVVLCEELEKGDSCLCRVDYNALDKLDRAQ